MLELGRSKGEKRAVVIGLSVVHLGALVGIVTVFAAGRARGMSLPPMLTVVAVVATTLWLFSFVLLSVNLAYYLLAPDGDDEPGDTGANDAEDSETSRAETNTKANCTEARTTGLGESGGSSPP